MFQREAEQNQIRAMARRVVTLSHLVRACLQCREVPKSRTRHAARMKKRETVEKKSKKREKGIKIKEDKHNGPTNIRNSYVPLIHIQDKVCLGLGASVTDGVLCELAQFLNRGRIGEQENKQTNPQPPSWC
jgi:hypothetical protein